MSTWTINGGPGLVSSSRVIPNDDASVVVVAPAEADWVGKEAGASVGIPVGTLVGATVAVADGATVGVGVGVRVGATVGNGV
ncbi:MAG: hypothetical protein V3T90_08440 [Anaerolineae bacterium]